MVEKPLFEKRHNIPQKNFKNVYVGYNLRFNPIIKSFTESLKMKGVVCQGIAGQYLPYWRVGRITPVHIQQRKMKAGSLLDLSHELDYCTWFLATGVK